MAPTTAVTPVKRFVAVLSSQPAAFEEFRHPAVNRWGEIDFVGHSLPFDATNYYEPEMGPHLQRTLVSFELLMAPESLVADKLFCNQLEFELAIQGKRTFNLDVGYLDHNKIVLGSVKFAGQKIHLGSGVYADLIARYRHGRYEPFEWTFPDFRDGRYDGDLAVMRKRYLKQLREMAG